MSKKQKTLFDTWNNACQTSQQNRSSSVITPRNCVPSTSHDTAVACHHLQSPSVFQSPKYSRSDASSDPEFDYEAGKTWIYPTNYPIRDYQFSIVQEALFKNTLVVLPTGLGKTFIAAVVMYNIYRWFPNGKVIFMAPTKPLVAQQVDACFKVTGISQEDTTQMTGTNTPELRKRMWLRKRVFFLTPQVLVNDLVRNICPASSIKCLVVDEAHKALGNHAYCQVIKELCNYTSQFRVLALTATPGSETQAVKLVLCNLQISHVEMRSEDSADVQEYTHIRDIEKIVVPLGDRLNSLKMKFLDVINVYLKRLTFRKAMTSKNPTSLSKYQMLKLRETFNQNPPPSIDRVNYGLAMADFSLCISLYHAYELLLLHGATSFYNFLMGILNGDKSIPHARSELLKNFEFEEIMQTVKHNYIPEPADPNVERENLPNVRKRVLPSHPKLDKLLEVVLHHFSSAATENITDTRVMIFTQYRDSVQEIVDMFNNHKPMVKVMSFVGQSSKSATSSGYSQKQQLKVIQQFRSGGYNTLVSTCVGEEGLDIGEVDLIVCYDCPKSPIRLVQRMGRTGRLRKGRIIMLVAEGKEEQMYNTCEYRKKAVHRAITKGFPFAQFYQNSPLLIPPGVKPVCVKKTVTIEPQKIVPNATSVSTSPYLTEEEMEEYNQHFGAPMNHAPLLPKRDCLILKKSAIQKAPEASGCDVPTAQSQLSLSAWTLWQTNPQRTYMIPHSSKSLLMSKILEMIHFPELLASKNASLNLSCLSDSSKQFGNISKAVDQFHTSFKQSRITDLLSISKTQDDFIGDVPSPIEETYELDGPILEKADDKANMPLFKQLFNISVPKFISYSNCNLESPPTTVRVLSTEDFFSIVLGNSSHQSKGPSILHVLNKKIKAKIKRKSKEITDKISFCSDTRKSVTTSKNISTSTNFNHDNGVHLCSVSRKFVSPTRNIDFAANLKNDDDSSVFDVCIDNPLLDTHTKSILDLQVEKKDEIDLKEISFDIDFDFPDAIMQDGLQLNNDNLVLNTSIIAPENDMGSTQEVVKVASEIEKASNSNNLFHIGNVGRFDNLKTCESRSPSKYPVLSGEEKIPVSLTSAKNDVETGAHVSSKCESFGINISSKLNKLSSLSKGNHLNFKNSDKMFSVSKKSGISSLNKKLHNYSAVSLASLQEKKSVEKRDYNNLQDFDNAKDLLTENISSSLNNNIVSANCSEKRKLSLINNVHPASDIENSLCDKFDSCPASFKKILNPFGKILKCHSTIEKVKENSSDEYNLNFDIYFSINDEIESKKEIEPVSSETPKDQLVDKDLEMMNDLKEFDENSQSILEQLFTSQKSLSASMDCSFSSPLTVKRCISETDADENKVVVSKKQCIGSTDNVVSTGASSNVFKVPPTKSDFSICKSKYPVKNSINQSVNMDEASQYTLTQLLSLIDCTEKLEKKSVSSPSIRPKGAQKYVDAIDVSSEDEVCPTPPKEEIKTKSKFIYCKKNLVRKSLAFEGLEKAHTNLNRTVFNGPCTSDSQFRNTVFGSCVERASENIKLKDSVSEKITVCNNKINSFTVEDESYHNKLNVRDIASDSSEKIEFDISFELPFPHEDLETTVKDESVDMNKAICVTSFLNENLCEEEDTKKCCSVVMGNRDVINIEKDSKNIIDIDKKLSSEDLSFMGDLEESESLLTSMENGGQNTVCQDISNIRSTEVHENSVLNKKCSVNKKSSNGNYPEDITTNLNFSFSSVFEGDDFENEQLAESNYTSSGSKINKNLTNPGSEHSKRTDCVDVHLMKENNCSSSGRNVLNMKENDFESIAASNNSMKSKQLESENRSNLFPKQGSKNSNYCFKITRTDLKPKISTQEKMDYKNDDQIYEDVLLFDLCHDDVTHDLLPVKPISSISKNSFIKASEFPSRNDSLGDFPENRDNSKDLFTLKPDICAKNIEESKILKNEISRRPENYDIPMVEAIESENYVDNDELMLEFDVEDGDLSFMYEIENHNPVVSKNQDLKVLKAMHESASDIIEIKDLNESTFKKVKQNNILKPVENCTKNPISDSNKWGSTSKFDMNTKEQAVTSNNRLGKPPDNLSTKTKTKSVFRNVLQNKKVIQEDEDDFQFVRKIEKKNNKHERVRKKSKKKRKGNEFLLSQAEVSGCDDSELESAGEEGNDFEESFINDESSQKEACTDQHAFYLRSLKNCAGLPQQFKLKYLDKNNHSFPSEQAECSTYLHDSFCVSSEDVSFLSSSEEEEYPPTLKNRNKENRKKLKRIITYESATSSEHEISPKVRLEDRTIAFSDNLNHIPLDESVIAIKKHKAKLVISSDEEDNRCTSIKPCVSRDRIKETAMDRNNVNPDDIIAAKKYKTKFISSDEEDEPFFSKPIAAKPQCPNGKNILVENEKKSVALAEENIRALNKFKPKFVSNSDEDNRNLFIKPTAVELFSKTEKIVTGVNNINSAEDFENNQKFEFSLDFDANDADFVPLSSNKKTEPANSIKILNSATKQNNLVKYNSMLTNLSSSKPMVCDSNTNSSECIQVSLPASKRTDTASANFSNKKNSPETSRSILSINVPSTECIQETGSNLEFANISFDIGWDGYAPLNESEVPSDIQPQKNSACVSLSKIQEAEHRQSVILVDSRELASGKPVISALRSLHKVNPIVMQLNSADYIISSRLAVKRVLDSEFSNCSMPPKVVEKIKLMIQIYEKSLIIVEQDNRKNMLSFNKNTTKYLQFAVHLNFHPSLKVLFSKSVENTSGLIFNLIEQEKKRGFHINVPVTLTPQNQKLYDFYSSFPKVSPICALNFIYYFPTIESCLKSSVEDLKKKGRISSHIALSIFKYFRSELTYHENL